MEGENMLEDYSDTEKLEVYENVMQNLPTGKHLVAYNIKRLMPDVKGKTILDIPCGTGHYVREMFKLGAAKVIASDLVARQLELSKERDKKAGIPEGFVQYYQHNAKIPKQLSTELADVCLCYHLLCFAENEGELRGMVRTLLANLKPQGYCSIIACSLNSSAGDEESVRREMESILDEEKLVHLDPPTSDRFKPRRHHIVSEGFHFNNYCPAGPIPGLQFSYNNIMFIWPYDVIYDVLREEGFSKVEPVPYEVDPSYKGSIDLQAYVNLHDSKIILAWK